MHIKSKTKLITFVFFVTLIFDIYAIFTQNKVLEMVFKPFLMTIVAILYLVSVKKPNFWYLSALLFSFWGDVLLLFEEKYFIFGLLSFLIAHLLYIKLTSTFFYKATIIMYIKCWLPFLLLLVGLNYFIINNLGKMLVPTIVYGGIISAFGAITLVNYLKKRAYSNMLLLFGSIIFIISDSLIALDKFLFHHIIFSILIIVLYSYSQYLICIAVIKKTKF